MKVGIVTQPLYANYGGILQNYALQQVLKSMGHEPVTLDYMPSLPFWRYCLYAAKTVIYSFIPSKRHPLKPYHHFLQRPQAIRQFVENKIIITDTLDSYSARQLKKYGVEAIIVGSDQVWRYRYNTENIEDMYLAFAKGINCRKVAYAASFGIEKWDYPEDVTSRVKELVQKFDAISVRELSAVGLCKDILGVMAKVVLDPTLLLLEKDYEPLCQTIHKKKEPYLVSYVLDADEQKQYMIDSFAKERGLVVKRMTVSNDGCSVGEWLSTIRNAEYVITDSFHGSVFSIIFRKQFYTFINEGRGADRFYTLFSDLGITNHLLGNGSTLPLGENIDYKEVDEKLSVLRDNSREFIKEALS